MKKTLYEKIWIFISVIGLAYTYTVYMENLGLEANGIVVSATVVEMSCSGSKSGGVLHLLYKGEEYSFNTP